MKKFLTLLMVGLLFPLLNGCNITVKPDNPDKDPDTGDKNPGGQITPPQDDEETIAYKAYLEEVETINGISVLIKKTENINIDVLKDIIDKVSAELGKSVVFFANIVNEQKVIFIAKAKENAANCGMLVKNAAIITGGNGGGRPDFAQAGGKDASKVDEALKAVKDAIK